MGLRKTSIVDIEVLLRGLGVKRGDVIMVHSSVFTLGLVEGGLGGIYHATRNVLGPDGTLVVPTFTYSFRRGEIFDVAKTPCPKTLGAFSEHIRVRADSVRSADPLFSMAAVGPEGPSLMHRRSDRCFGQGSIYEALFARDMLIVAIGITYDTGISAFMHLERLAGVDYRRDLLLSGKTIRSDGVVIDDTAIHFERNLEKYPTGRRNRIPFGLEMERDGISRALEYGSGRHIAIRAKQFEDYVLERLAKNPWVMFNRNVE